MIFVLHYILFNAGLSAVLVLLALFLQTYTAASLSEIGALLMALPFVSILIKPLFCALADRHQAHRSYLIGALALMAAGYGSLAIAPFFPEFVSSNGRLVWYLDICSIVVGFSAFGVVWSLGDALSVNGAQVNGVSWGTYRVWGVISWGGFGALTGQINELTFLPKYVPGLLLLIGSLCLEILLLSIWPRKHFQMGGEHGAELAAKIDPDDDKQLRSNSICTLQGADGATAAAAEAELQLREQSSSKHQDCFTPQHGSVRADPRLVKRVASLLMEDLGGSLRKSLSAQASQRDDEPPRLADILAEQARDSKAASPIQSAELRRSAFAGLKQRTVAGVLATPTGLGSLRCAAPQRTSEPRGAQRNASISGARTRATRSTWRRTQIALARMNTLGAASGHAIIDLNGSSMLVGDEEEAQNGALGGEQTKGAAGKQQASMYMSSLASTASFTRAAAAARALADSSSPMGRGKQRQHDKDSPFSAALRCEEIEKTRPAKVAKAKAHDLQLVLLKLIVKRDANIWKFLIMFTLFGMMLAVHLSYFFVHLARLCTEHGADFSSVMGGMLIAHSISEVISFMLIVPHYVPRVGRTGALLTCALFYALRFLYYGTYYPHNSPFTGVPFELCHGIVYGIIYSLITDIACECVDHIDHYLPELVECGLVEPHADANRLKLPLRATMQGVFSGAFDGLGNGIGALFGGLFIDAYSFAQLWRCCAYMCLTIMILYALSEWRQVARRRRRRRPSSEASKLPQAVELTNKHLNKEIGEKKKIEQQAIVEETAPSC